VIVRRGTPYPTSEPLARLTIKATYAGQTQLGIAIFEMGQRRLRTGQRPMEIVFDPSGAVRLMPVSPEEEEQRANFWMNENNPTFLTLSTPAEPGERCFEVHFAIDCNKRLLITARELKTGRLTHKDYPVVKLT